MTAEELVARYGRVLYNLCLRLTGNRADAEDLCQEALLRGVKGWASFRGEADPGTWLYRIAANLWKNRLRAKSAWGFAGFLSLDFLVSPEAEAPPEPPSPERTPEQAAADSERRERLEAALSGLEPEERAVLVLRELDGRSYQQIADALSLPLGTVKSRLARARLRLAEALSPEEADHAP